MNSTKRQDTAGPRYLTVELPGPETLRWIGSLLKLTWLPLVLAIVLGWLASVLSVVSSSLLAYVLSTNSKASSSGLVLPAKLMDYIHRFPSPLIACLWIALGLTIFGGLLSIIVDWSSTWVHLIINRSLTPRVIEISVTGLPHHSLDASTAVQRWLCKRDVVYFLTDSVAAPIRDVGTIVIALIATYRTNTLAGNVSAGCLLIWVSIGAILTRQALQSSKVAAHSHEIVGRVIRDGSCLRKDLSRPSLIRFWREKNRPVADDLQKSIAQQGLWNVLLGGILSTIAVGLPIIAVIAASFSSGLGSMLAILLYLARLGGPLQSLARVLPWFQQNLITLKRVYDVAANPEHHIPVDLRIGPPIDGTLLKIEDWVVRVDKRTLISYPAIEVGARPVCIAGRSGSGKSTLLLSLAGLMEIKAGHLVLDGHLIERSGLNWREACCLVPQEPELVPGLLKDNLWGFPEWRPGERATQALSAVLSGIQLRENSFVTIDEKGVSVGQRRALSVLRGLGSDARVLLLDEPIAGLDDRLAKLIGASIQEAQNAGRLVIVGIHEHDIPRLGLQDPVIVFLDGTSTVVAGFP